MDSEKTDWMQTNIFIYVVIIVCVFVLGILIANAVYFRRIADSTLGTTVVPKDQARNMFYLNLIMIMIVGVVFCFAVFRAIVGITRYNRFKEATSSRFDQFGTWAVQPQAGLWPTGEPGMYQQIAPAAPVVVAGPPQLVA